MVLLLTHQEKIKQYPLYGIFIYTAVPEGVDPKRYLRENNITMRLNTKQITLSCNTLIEFTENKFKLPTPPSQNSTYGNLFLSIKGTTEKWGAPEGKFVNSINKNKMNEISNGIFPEDPTGPDKMTTIIKIARFLQKENLLQIIDIS